MSPALADNTKAGVQDFVRRYFRADIARSLAYINAFETIVHKRVIERSFAPVPVPYAAGTAEADAWDAGFRAGRAVYLDGVY